MRLGHMFLVLIYASSFVIGFTISKDIVYPEKKQVKTVTVSSLSSHLSEAIGMNDFFRQLNEGM